MLRRWSIAHGPDLNNRSARLARGEPPLAAHRCPVARQLLRRGVRTSGSGPAGATRHGLPPRRPAA